LRLKNLGKKPGLDTLLF